MSPLTHAWKTAAHLQMQVTHMGCGFLCPSTGGLPTLILPHFARCPEKYHIPPRPPINSNWDVTGKEVSVICSIF